MDPRTGAPDHPGFEPPDSALRIDVTRVDPHLVRITLDGELDLLTVGRLRDALLPMHQAATNVIIDLNGLSFLSSTGVQAIVVAHRAVTDSGATLSLVVAPEHRTVVRVLAITGLDQLLTVTSD